MRPGKTMQNDPGLGHAAVKEAPRATGVLATTRTVTRSVLVMDDDPIIRTVTSLMLEAAGYKVSVATDGEEAIDAFKNALRSGSPFDAVMLDLHIPGGLGGKETVRRLLEIDPDVKAIVASGDACNPALKDFRTFGFRRALVKPFSIEDLHMTLQSVMCEGTAAR